ncbi:hypothetical protein CP533_0569, partial [Ophiocordyceps camponoti-saundersi (nom. inval.)]
CELCKARKVKCDRAEPACSWCARHGRPCVYLERQKPGSRIGFTLELESKVNRIDALLQTLWRRVETHISQDHHHHHCNTWCPVLDRKSTFAVLFGSTSLSESDRILLYAIVATTLRFLKDPRLSADTRAHYHAVSRHAVIMYAMENVTVASLKALVILALDELGTSEGPRGWNMLALLVQSVRHLGLCLESRTYLNTDTVTPNNQGPTPPPKTVPESWIDDEGRRRLCWMVYLLDRYATVATTTLDFMLDDGGMRRVLPCSYDLFSRNVPVETSGGAVSKPENLGTTTTGWRNTYRSLDAALDGWLQSLPSEYSRISALCHSDPASRVANWFVLHSAYVTAVVRLHSAAAYPTARTAALASPSHYAMQRCLSAVQSLRDITQDVYEANGLDLVGPPFAFALWVAARLLLVHAATVGGPVDGKVDFFIDMLASVGEHWEVANHYARVLSRVVRRGRQGEASFGAMRRSAYDLVGLAASTRRSGLEEATSRPVSPAELDCVDVFDFFNYPRPPPSSETAGPPPGLLLHRPGGGLESSVSAVPDPDNDWLVYSSSFG